MRQWHQIGRESRCRNELELTGEGEAAEATVGYSNESRGANNRGSSRRGNDNLNSLEYKLFFYPWMSDPSYSIDDKVTYDIEMYDYFVQLEKYQNIIITEGQRNWYALQSKILGAKIRQEYPSTVSEAFLASSDAYYFAEAIEKAYKDNRCLYTSLYDALLPVFVAMDIGLNDLTVIIFFQLCHGEVRIIDYYEDKNKDTDFYAKFLLQDKPYLYNTIFLPHDARKRDALVIENTYERDMRRLFSHTPTKFHVLPRMDKQIQISHARIKLDRCVFNVNRCKGLLDHMSKYRKRWHEGTGRYLEEPLHTVASNYADAFQYAMQGVSHLEATGLLQGSAMDKHRKAVEGRHKILW